MAKSQNFKLYEKKMLETMSTLKEFEGTSVVQRKKIIKAIWKHLNEKVGMQPQAGGGFEEDLATKVLPVAQKGLDFVNFLSRVVFPIIL